ncbi:hypothetical protein M1N80_04410 [Peptococcaceae bacterium]|nr:hypothetical protein [Peptococcaceae bacterium]
MLSIEALVHVLFFAIIGGAAGALIIQSFRGDLISEDKAKIWALILVVGGAVVGAGYAIEKKIMQIMQ